STTVATAATAAVATASTAAATATTAVAAATTAVAAATAAVATAAATAAAVATTTAAATRLAGLGGVHAQVAAAEVRAVQGADRLVRGGVFDLHEAEAARAAGLAVSRQGHADDLAVARKQLLHF